MAWIAITAPPGLEPEFRGPKPRVVPITLQGITKLGDQDLNPELAGQGRARFQLRHRPSLITTPGGI